MLKYIERGHECTRFKKPNHMIHYFNMLHTKSRLPSLSQNIQFANTWESQNVSGFLEMNGPQGTACFAKGIHTVTIPFHFEEYCFPLYYHCLILLAGNVRQDTHTQTFQLASMDK